ncbi:MAG: hypothetical protein OXG70_03120, partial [Cyanobacteria bacterium MAG IRC1_bin_28]|nr:hypothetical protein [Cyanobacteria bacterium MAG IRC1_bin_28]
KGSTAIYKVPATEEKGAPGRPGRGGARPNGVRPLQRNGSANGQSKNPALMDRRHLSANGATLSQSTSPPVSPSAVASPEPEVNTDGVGATSAETVRKRRSRSRASTA